MVDNAIIEERKKKFANFFMKSNVWVVIGLLIVIFIAFHIRTANLDGLRDVTTGGWTLGPDLDPYLFLRWAKYIVETGSLMEKDTLRYVPLGFDTKGELILLPYMIAWFHKIMTSIGLSESIEHSAVLFPAYMFVLTIPAFFLFVRQIFLKSLGKNKAGAIALVSSLFLSIIPVLLPRTIAGIPEKESVAFLFMFMALYLFILSWESHKNSRAFFFALLAGLFTAGMALVWGGYIYLFLILAVTAFIFFLIERIDRRKIISYSIWLVSALIVMNMFSIRYEFSQLIRSFVVLVSFSIVFFFFVLELVKRYKSKLNNIKYLNTLPLTIIALVFGSIIGAILLGIIFGPGFVYDNLQYVVKNLIAPITDRFGVTVAENRQPYFNEWVSNFGPSLGELIRISSLNLINLGSGSVLNLKVFFVLFLISTMVLFNNTMREIFSNFESKVLLISTIVFTLSLILGRYSEASLLNGTSIASKIFYLIGLLALLVPLAIFYRRKYIKNELKDFEKLGIGVIIFFVFMLFGLISARGSVRTVMILAIPGSIAGGYLLANLIFGFMKKKRYFKIISAITIVIFAIVAISYYNSSFALANSYVPDVYTQQWQKAMSWVRTSTPEGSVFAHWWDYGYWVQTRGERATVLDGGNAIGNWNRLMGRNVLTGTDSYDSADFLYAHKATHLLIDSTDIGKYGAFSSIGSDENYDRRSWISTFLRDDSQSQESKNRTLYLYRGGFSLDEDIIYYQNGTRIFLPGIGNSETNGQNVAGLGAILVELDKNGSLIYQPRGIFVDKTKQYNLPIRYAFYNNELHDFGSGVESGIFLMDRLDQNNQQYGIAENGALLYLSNRTVKSQLARLYLYNEENEIFNLVHTEDDYVLSSLKSQNLDVSDFIYYQGIRGPIKIWEINYPSGIEIKEEYLKKEYPNSELNR